MTSIQRGTLLGLAFVGAVAAFGYLHWPRVSAAGAAPVIPRATVASDAPAPALASTEATSTAAVTPADSILPSLPTGVRGFRTGQRRSHADRLASSEDVTLAVQELEQLANGGDADAAGTLADHHFECAIAAGLSLPDYAYVWDRFAQGATLDPATRARAREQNDARLQRCAPSGEIDLDASGALAEAWYQRALMLGDLTAIARQSGEGMDPIVANRMRRAALIEILEQGAPEALAEHAGWLPVYNHAFTPEAYAMAACTLIEACAADVEAYVTREFPGMQTMTGVPGPLLSLRTLSPRARQLAAGQSAEILRYWQARRFEEMLTPEPPLPPPKP